MSSAENGPFRSRSSWLLASNAVLLVVVISQWIVANQSTVPATTATSSTMQVKHSSQQTSALPHRNSSDDILYGHIHMAKTAGSTINGELAVRYERVCGHKGYSFDALRPEPLADHPDAIARVYPGYNRGRVPVPIMMEIGFQNCDFFSTEESWSTWGSRFGRWPFPVEMHLPCRDPIDHLMSQCNYRRIDFDCNNWQPQMQKCMVEMNRFSKQILQTGNNFTFKCYDAMNIQGYIKYMGEHLQHRKITKPYHFRPMNKNRTKETECVWQDPDLQTEIRDFMVRTWDYYDFCVNDCMGTENELPLP